MDYLSDSCKASAADEIFDLLVSGEEFDDSTLEYILRRNGYRLPEPPCDRQ